MATKTETQINNLQKKLQDTFGVLTTKKSMVRIGRFLVVDMQKRIRLGYGSARQLGQKEKLKPLTSSYVNYRKKNRSSLDKTTRPKKSNLTFTGQLVRDLRLTKVTKANFVIGHSNKLRRRETLTNRELSGFVQIQGRPYMNVTGLEFKRLLRFYQNDIIKPTLSKI